MGSFDRFFIEAARRLADEVESGQLSVAELKLGDDARVIIHAEMVAGDNLPRPPDAVTHVDPDTCPQCGSSQIADGGDTRDERGARVPNMVDRLCVRCQHRFSVPAG
jgi:hypothetical protein